jgi:integrating conjugative element protein (TIGR03761 family)
LLLHTRHAVSLYVGPNTEARGSGSGIPDGQRFALALRNIWSLTAHDNPYADWMLIQFDQSLHEVRGRIARATQGPLDALEALKHQGLQYSLLEAEAPTQFELVPDSPYTYATASVIAAFDHYARMIRTLVRKDRMSDIEGHQAIQPLVRTLRTLFASPLPWVRKLQSQHVRRLRRNDFLPEANTSAQARVSLARELFGPLPRAVFTGAKQPRHTLRDPLVSAALRHGFEEASREWAEPSPSVPEVVQ